MDNVADDPTANVGVPVLDPQFDFWPWWYDAIRPLEEHESPWHIFTNRLKTLDGVAYGA